MSKNVPKWSLREQLERKAHCRMKGEVLGFLLGPKVPENYPTPTEFSKMSLEQLQELVPVLQKFLTSIGGPDIPAEHRALLQLGLNLTKKVKPFSNDSETN